MARIAVITDSAADLERATADAAGVRVVPLDVRIGELGPAETAKLSMAEFWQVCATSETIPETAAPSPGAFRDAFLEARDEGHDGVLCVTMSSRLSATYQAACAGSDAAGRAIEVRVVDSGSVTVGQGMAVLTAARRARGASSLDEVEAAVADQLSRTVLYGALDGLEYLRRGGRIGSAQAVFGSLLSIKPVIQLRDGVVEGESRQRTRARSLRYLAEKFTALGPLERLAVVHAAASEADLDLLLGLLAPIPVEVPTTVSHLGPVIGAHTGPGTIGVAAVLA